MPILTLSDGELSWGELPVLDHCDFSVQAGERIGLIGRNGTGKTSLLKVLARHIDLEGGELRTVDALKVVYVEQEPVLPPADTLLQSLQLRGHFNRLSDDKDLFSATARLQSYMERLGVDKDMSPCCASGGEKKRAALCLALSLQSDLLLLDEPTNHLDIEAILTLEALLANEFRATRSLVVVTHDRAFLDTVVTRIVELDRGILRSYPGNFAAYEARKADELNAEALARRRFDKFWAQEEVWIRKGIEARRTRNEGRVRRLEQLRRERSERRDRLGNIRLRIDAGERSGKIVAEAKDLTKSFGSRPIVSHLDFKLMRGDKLGILGKNGTGKSTLIKLLLGELTPDSGLVKLGTNLSVAYYDQLRARLDPTKTVQQTIAPGSDWIEVGGVRKHVMSYLADFLFAPRRANVAVSSLSGGERNRLMLARLFALPANLLVLDEPTNDLDIDSLELLEETLETYPGTVILVSHDRRFLDNVVTQILYPADYDHPNGTWMESVGGYEDWVRNRPQSASVATKPSKVPRERTRNPTLERVRLSFRETQELQNLPAQIEALEAEQATLAEKLCDPDYHKRDVAEVKSDKERLEALPALLENTYARWESLLEKERLAQTRGSP